MISSGHDTSPFSTEVTPSGVTIVVATGPLVFPDVNGLRQQLISLAEGGANRLVVDLTRVTTIDSTGVGALVSGLKAARARGGDLRLAGPSAAIASMLNIMRLDTLLVASDSAENAFS